MSGVAQEPVEVVYELHSLKFTPYNEKEKELNSNSILRDVMTFLSQQKMAGKGYLINRHANRERELPRELFLTDCVQMVKEKRYRCTIALLRSGRTPMFKPADEFKLIPLDTSMGSIAEKTHFYIDYSKGVPILCIEFNYYGPRPSDIEYYLRSVARDKLRIAKATELTVFMDVNLDKAIEEFANVLNFEIKIQPQKLHELDKVLVGEYLTGMVNLGNKVKPRHIKIEAYFQTQGKTIGPQPVNTEGNIMVRKFLNTIKAQRHFIDCFDNFEVVYQDKLGNEEVLNLIKGKKAITLVVDMSVQRTERQWYELIEPELTKFVESL
jgi:hypothetical protein